MFEQLKGEYDKWVQGMWSIILVSFFFFFFSEGCEEQPRQDIQITLPDGSERKGTSWETSPMDVAKDLSKSLPEKIVIAKVDGQLWDLERPLESSCKLELLDFDHPEGEGVVLFFIPLPLPGLSSLISNSLFIYFVVRKTRLLALIRTRSWGIR
jgi:threonyl-tRNA synthetase